MQSVGCIGILNFSTSENTIQQFGPWAYLSSTSMQRMKVFNIEIESYFEGIKTIEILFIWSTELTSNFATSIGPHKLLMVICIGTENMATFVHKYIMPICSTMNCH